MSERVLGNGANPSKRTLYVCQNEFCVENGAQGYVEQLRQKVSDRSGESQGIEVKVLPYICFNCCDWGPIVILYPDCQCYARVSAEDLDAIAKAAFSSEPKGPEIERLQENALEIDPDILDGALFALKRKN